MHWCLLPAITVLYIGDPIGALAVSFILTFAFWSVNYIAAEIEMPFGDDQNDLPIERMQDRYNDVLSSLLEPLVEAPPEYSIEEDILSPKHLGGGTPKESAQSTG